MTFDYTICIPIFTQPHFLSATLHGLINNSRLTPRIIVMDTRHDLCRPTHSPCRDFYTHPDTRQRYHHYTSVLDFFEKNAAWLEKHHVEYWDLSDQFAQWWEDYHAGKYGTPKVFEDGMDIAFKNNYIMDYVDTEWMIPNWDADFYPMPGWDAFLFSTMEHGQANYGDLACYIPTHVQPAHMDPLPNWPNYWEDSRCISRYRPTAPTVHSDCAFTAEELVQFYQDHKAQGWIHAEPAGHRDKVQWVPIFFRTNVLRNVIGPWSYQGGGYDLEFDNRCGTKGIIKVTHGESWIYHKAWLICRPEELHVL
jgi:hypothetical protein